MNLEDYQQDIDNFSLKNLEIVGLVKKNTKDLVDNLQGSSNLFRSYCKNYDLYSTLTRYLKFFKILDDLLKK